MRKQIAAANWKMNLTATEADALLTAVLEAGTTLKENAQVLFAVPAPYLAKTQAAVEGRTGYGIAAQNCSNKKAGAFTGEVSAEMLASVGVRFCLVGHSERREYFVETGAMLAEKIDRCLQNNITPLFCCGEVLAIRESGEQAEHVRQQVEEALFHLPADEVKKVVIAYEPVWAIGTGRTASTQQAQEMHHYLRQVMADKWGQEVADEISILYGGSVKASNAAELFGCADVDGGLVGGASLVAAEFVQIIAALK